MHFRRSAAPIAAAALIASLAIAAPVSAASPPEITADDVTTTIQEGWTAQMGGTWSDADGDDVTLTASEGSVEKVPSDPGRWTWTEIAPDGPASSQVTVTATDTDGSDSVTFDLTVTNAPPEAWTNGPRYVPVDSLSDRQFLWTAKDVEGEELDTTVDCGSGNVTATGDWIIEGVKTLRCHFGNAGETLVGVKSTDDDGASTDGRMPVRATWQVRSVADGQLIIDGADGDDQMGGALATPDLNGDGDADIAIGGTTTSTGAGTDPGYVMVVFGGPLSGSIDLGALTDGAGFRIDGNAGTGFGRALDSAGDLNGDGLDDLLIGASGASGDDGAVYVIFGSTDDSDLDISSLPSERGVVLAGGPGGLAGMSLAGIGDANGDGFDDILIGSPGLDAEDGAAHLLFGREAFTGVDLGDLPPDRGIRIDTPGNDTGWSVAGGDVNGDGRADAVVSSRLTLESNAAVVYGKSSMTDTDAATMTADRGFLIGGGDENLGILSVAAGDMDGDGDAEVAIAHPYWNDSSNWAISIIRGASTNASIPLLATAPSSRLVRVLPPADEIGNDMTMFDWNGDGRDDLVVGGAYSGENGEGSGSAFVIKGTATLSNLNLGAFDARWFRVDGDNTFAFAGDAVAGGDVNDDGHVDLLIGAPGRTDWTDESLPGRVAVFAGAKAETKAPSVTAPVRSIPHEPLVGTKVVVRSTWTGSDKGSGIDQYELAQQTDDGTWVLIAATTSKAVNTALATGHEYQFRVRGIDKAGNRSAWAYGTTFDLKGYQETSSRITYRGTWKTGTSPTFSGGTTKYASRAGKRATLTFTGRQVVFTAPTGPTRGTASVYINGSYVGTVSLYSVNEKASRVIKSWKWSTSATRTISIRVKGTSGHPRVDIDKFIVIR